MLEAVNLNTTSDPSTLTQRELGAYYTSNELTAILSKWAIRTPNDLVLEPSFGGCGFLQSAVSRFLDVGCKQAHTQLYGCDIDPKAFNHLSTKLNTIESINNRFLHKDFLKVLPTDFLISSFEVIIGNPPYISLHNLSVEQLESVENWISNHLDLKISKRASLWAYFVLHGMSFLKEGGRMAWVLPGSFLQADYGVQLQKILLSQFGKVVVFNLGERAFLTEGTQERTIVLFCDEYGKSGQDFEINYCEFLSDLANAIDPTEDFLQTKENLKSTKNQLPDAYKTIANRDDVYTLGDLARVLIGTVTGANKFFVLSPAEVAKHQLESKYLNPILSKFAHIKGLEIAPKDFAQWQLEDHRCWIFHIDDESIASKTASAYVATFDEAQKSKNETFKKRPCWLASDDKRIPDAFLSYMNNIGPRLVLNSASINSTNTIHRVFFNDSVSLIQKKLAVISLHTTFSQLSAELVGRSYGSGVLKLEPTEAKKIKIVLPNDKTDKQINQVFSMLDELWRSGKLVAAQKQADDFILGDYSEKFASLHQSLQSLRKRRKRPN